MNINDFMGRWPFFGSDGRKSNLHDLAEEVPFEEVNESPKKPVVDKNARAKQISKELESKIATLLDKSPFAALHFMVMFTSGAEWGDEHPVSDYINSADRTAALRTEVTTMLDRAANGHYHDFMVYALSYAIFAAGVRWADNNPAQILN